MSQDKTTPFPDDALMLEHYLGPTANLGPIMTAKIPTQNGQMLYISTNSPLAPDKKSDQERSDANDQFMAMVHERLESQVLPTDLEDIGLEDTSQHDSYEDEKQNKQTFSPIEEAQEKTPKEADYYLGAEILLLRKDQIIRGHVTAHRRDANGNTVGSDVGKANANTVLDTRVYQLEYPGGKVAELTINVVVESMYAKCDAYRNEYLLLNLLIDYWK